MFCSKMFCYTRGRFQQVFKPLYNMEAYFRNNPYYFAYQVNAKNNTDENPFMKKYADKISAFQNSHPEEYKKRSENCKLAKKPPINYTSKTKPRPSEMMDILEKRNTSHSFQKNEKTLNDIVKIDLLKDKSAEEIETIWKEYHKNKSGLYAILPSEAFKKIISTSLDCRTFLLPLPKVDTYEYVMSQFSGNSCFFTPLVQFQTYKENAPVCLTITYYPELQEEKGIVLMRGEFDEDTLKPHEAQCLSNQLQLYYGGKDAKKSELLWNFNKNPDAFKHMDLISELQVGL